MLEKEKMLLISIFFFFYNIFKRFFPYGYENTRFCGTEKVVMARTFFSLQASKYFGYTNCEKTHYFYFHIISIPNNSIHTWFNQNSK